MAPIGYTRYVVVASALALIMLLAVFGCQVSVWHRRVAVHSFPPRQARRDGASLPHADPIFQSLQPIDWQDNSHDRTQCSSENKLAYAFYATDETSATLAAVNIRRLYAFGKRGDADVVVILLRDAGDSVTGRLLRAGATCILERDTIASSDEEETWRLSNMKLYVLNMTKWQRVIYFDADGIILRNPDHLFEVPINDTYPIAMPRAYWLAKPTPFYTSCLLICRPAEGLFRQAMQAFRRTSKFDMDNLNDALGNQTLRLASHEAALVMLLDTEEGAKEPTLSWFDGMAASSVLRQTSYVHFSTWPRPKPWLMSSGDLRDIASHPSKRYILAAIQTFRIEYSRVRRMSRQISSLLSHLGISFFLDL